MGSLVLRAAEALPGSHEMAAVHLALSICTLEEVPLIMFTSMLMVSVNGGRIVIVTV